MVRPRSAGHMSTRTSTHLPKFAGIGTGLLLQSTHVAEVAVVVNLVLLAALHEALVINDAGVRTLIQGDGQPAWRVDTHLQVLKVRQLGVQWFHNGLDDGVILRTTTAW